jgi:hypothetical protein
MEIGGAGRATAITDVDILHTSFGPIQRFTAQWGGSSEVIAISVNEVVFAITQLVHDGQVSFLAWVPESSSKE